MSDKPCIWTTQALYEHFTALREVDERAMQAALEAMNYRLAGMNEFRATVEDVQKQMLPRKEAWTAIFGTAMFVIALMSLIIHWGK